MVLDNNIRLFVQGLDRPARLDRVLRDHFPNWGRRAVGLLINARKVKVNGRTVWLSSWQVKNGDRLEILEIPPEKPPSPAALDDAWIIAHESDLLVLDKPAGMLSHVARSNRPGDLLSLATERFGPLTLFHRLDRDASGVVLLTRPGPINRALDAAFKGGAVKKEYIAAVPAGNALSAEGVIRVRIGSHPRRRDMMVPLERGGRPAVTRYQVIEEAAGLQLLRLWPETGRTHQLRVHLLAMGAPILGDRLYGAHPLTAKRLMLHACQLSLPESAGFPARVFSAPVPDDFVAELPRPLQALFSP